MRVFQDKTGILKSIVLDFAKISLFLRKNSLKYKSKGCTNLKYLCVTRERPLEYKLPNADGYPF